MLSKIRCPQHAHLERLLIEKNIEEIRIFLKENKACLDFNTVVEIPDIFQGSLILYVLKISEIATVFIEEIGSKEMIANIAVERLFVNQPNEGLYEGLTVFWYLAACPELHPLLFQKVDMLTPENVSMGPAEGPYKGKTVLWYLAAVSALRPLLLQRPELLTLENVSMEPVEGPNKGKTALWYLAACPELLPLLLPRPELLTLENVSMVPVEDPGKGVTVLCYLAGTPALRPLLLQRPELLTPENVSMGPVEGPEKGKTVLLCLAASAALRPLLHQRPELLTPENVSMGAVEGPNKGITVLYWLALTPVLHPLLIPRPELLTPENVSMGPAEGLHKGKTVLWFLTGVPTLRPLLLQRPELLTPENVSMGASEGPTKGTTVLCHLARAPEMRPLLLQKPELLTGRWLGDSILYLLKKEVATQMLMQVYESTLLALRTENWTAMVTLLQQNPWLARIRTDAQQNTLLHSLVNTVNQYKKNRVLHFLHHQKSMLKLLRKEVSLLENTEGETADLLAGTIELRDAVRAPVSFYQSQLEHLLLDDEENFRFISEVLCHKYALGGVVLKIADPEKKEVQIATTLELVSYLGEQINLAGSFTDLLTPNALLQIKALINKCNAYNDGMSGRQEGFKLLTEADRFRLHHVCSRLAHIHYELSPHNKEALPPGKRKQAEHPEEMRQAKRVKTTTHCFFAEEHHEPVESTVNVEAHATL